MKFCDACGAIIVGNSCLKCFNSSLITRIRPEFNRTSLTIAKDLFHPSPVITEKIGSLRGHPLADAPKLPNDQTRADPSTKLKVQAASQMSKTPPTDKDPLSRFEGKDPADMIIENYPALKQRVTWEKELNINRKVIKSIRDIGSLQEKSKETKPKLKEKEEEEPQRTKI